MSHGRSDPCVQLKGEPELGAAGGLISWLKKLFGLPSAHKEHKPTHAGSLMGWIKRMFGHRATPTTIRRRRSSPRFRRSRSCRANSSSGLAWSRCGETTAITTKTTFTSPGRRSVRHDSGTESHSEMPALTMEPSNLFIVADGMGGQQAGEQASLMAVDLIPRAIQRRLTPEEADPGRIKEAIRDAVAEVNQEILGSSGAVTEFSNMGTTVVLAQFRSDRVFVAGIGDSRAYRLRDGRLEQLTKDHSLADALLDAGTITADELANHKFKNVLYLYLGSKDARGGPEEVRSLDVRPGDGCCWRVTG